MSSQFPKDEHGQYLTLECIIKMKNAEYVNVFFIQTDLQATFIPSNVLQDGQTTHAEKLIERIYFKQEKNVRVDYSINLTSEEKSILLRDLS